MGVIRAEPARVTDWATRSIGAAWRAFDLQLAAYAALLGTIGLLMAYSNSVEEGQSLFDGGTTFARALMWTGIALIVFLAATAFDYRWLRTFAWPLYVVQIGLLGLTLAIGSGVGGSARWVSIGPVQFQFSELAKILMIIVLANYLASEAGPADLAAVDPGRMPPRRPAVDPRHGPAGPRDVARPRWRSSAGCCSCPGRASSGSARSPSPSSRRCRSSGTTSSVTISSSGSSASSIRAATSRARAGSSSSRRSPSARAARSGRA